MRLRECAGWFVPLLFANSRRQVYLCPGPYNVWGATYINSTAIVGQSEQAEIILDVCKTDSNFSREWFTVTIQAILHH